MKLLRDLSDIVCARMLFPPSPGQTIAYDKAVRGIPRVSAVNQLR